MLHREAIHLPNGDTITEEDAQTLENFSPHIHLPLSRALAHFAHIDVQDTQLQNAIINGLPLPDGVFGHINNSHIIATLPNKEVSLLTQEDGVFRVKKNYVYTSSP